MMDAVEFVKQLRRMIERGVPRNCFICPCVGQETDLPEEVVAEVEEWAKDHPVKTRQSEFLKMCPNAPIHPDTGIVKISPCEVDAVLRGNCPGVGCCPECRKKFWLAEVE